jgi:hypothetical protein
MTEPGEQRAPTDRPPTTATRPPTGLGRLRPRTNAQALAEALLVALVSAVAWAFVKGILEFPGVLAVAVVGGWAIGALLWSVRAHPALAATIALMAWVLGLVLTWLTAMAILPDSSRSFFERVEHTPLLEWLSPQFGVIEVLGLVFYMLAALYGARPRAA